MTKAKNDIQFIGHGTAIVWVRGEPALIDELDVPLIAPLRWSITRSKSGTSYLRAYIGGGRLNQKCVRMHRFILGTTDSRDVDHINGDGLDNRRANLRAISRAENLINTGPFKTNTSGIRGVAWYPPYKKWCAAIQVRGKRKTLGYFTDKMEAAGARRAAEELYFPGANRTANNG